MRNFILLRTDKGRRLFVADPWLQLQSDDYAGVRWPSCLIASDRRADLGSVRPALRQLLRAGATYFCFFGPNASELHAATDLLDVQLTDGRDIPVGRGDFAGTVGENDTELQDTLYFFAALAHHADSDQFDRIVLPLGLQAFKDDLLERLRTSGDF